MKTKRRAAYFFTSLKLFLREYRLFVLLGCLCLLGGIVVGVLSARSFGEDYYKLNFIFELQSGSYSFAKTFFLALLFGWLGERNKPLPPWLAPAILLLLAAASAALACLRLPVSILWQGRLSAMLWVMCALFAALFVLNCVLLRKNRGNDCRLAAALTGLSAVCTVCFTLLDDVLTPLFYRLSAEAALAWFYSSFTAMIPQTVCCVVSVSVLFLPLRKCMEFAAKKR